MNICRPCGYGKYQPEEGSFSCRLCGIGKTTRTKVAVSEEECRDECADGKQLAQDGTCEPCMLGTYRKKGLHLSCERCPDKTTTPRYSQVSKSPIQSRLTFHNQHYLNLFIDLNLKWTRGEYDKIPVFWHVMATKSTYISNSSGVLKLPLSKSWEKDLCCVARKHPHNAERWRFKVWFWSKPILCL